MFERTSQLCAEEMMDSPHESGGNSQFSATIARSLSSPKERV
jgi:hypothetical protein